MKDSFNDERIIDLTKHSKEEVEKYLTDLKKRKKQVFIFKKKQVSF